MPRIAQTDDAIREQANRLAPLIGALIESQSVTINGATTAMAMVTAAILAKVAEGEFERAVASFADALRINRAMIAPPDAREVN